MLIESASNGLGGQSMLLLYLACMRQIPARYSITADTGSEEDRQLCDGTRISARDFFERHVRPMGEKHGVECFFVRSKFSDRTEFPPLHADLKRLRDNVPLFGSEGGQLRQTCTDKWKVRAIHQQIRRLGGKIARVAIGIHWGEATAGRVRGRWLGKLTADAYGWNLYQTFDGRETPKPIKWMKHSYPLVDLKMDRQAVRDKLKELGIPYLVTSECDHCPHKDDERWLASSPETIDRVAGIEEGFGGEFFFTDKRIPLKLAIEEMRKNPRASDPVFGCKNGLCGV